MTQIITTSSTVAGVNITTAINEFIYVAEGVTVASIGSDALRGSLGAADINILGNLVGGNDGLELTDTADANGFFDITIGTTGSVVGNVYGVRISDDNNALINHGLVSGTSAGVYNNNGDNFKLSNTGTISSNGSYGVYNNGGSNFQLSNSGTISSSGLYGVNNQLGANFQLSNSGTISSSDNFGVYNNGGSNFLLTNSGTISSTANTGVRSTGTSGTIINFGLIESTDLSAFSNAISILDNIANTAVTVTNYGTLSAAGGVAIVGDFTGSDEIHNFGTIVGDINNGGGDDLVENGGMIQGDVLLGSGNDTYDGEGGTVTGIIFGDTGNDMLSGGRAADRFNGGADFDTVSYATSLGGVAVNLQTGAASSFDAAGDVLSNIENLIGSSGADYLAGDAGVNVLDGGADDDSLYGRVGADTLNGGAGDDRLFGGMGVDILNGGDDDDTLVGGAGADTLDGGNGIDTADYSSSSAAVTMNLQTNVHSGGDAAGDSLANIERVIGTSFADDIAGSFGDNVMIAGDGVDRLQGRLGLDDLYGGGGNDRLFGGVDNDRLFGGTGNDMLYGGNDNDLFIMENSFGNDRIMDFTNGSEFVDVSAVTGATTATLNVTGGGASNVMVDFGGLDTIEFVGITNAALITEADFIF